MCGVIGIYGQDDISRELAYGLTALQHRGHDSAGIVTLDRTFHIKKGLGLVNNIFREEHFRAIKGYCGVGHVRYATIGNPDLMDAQPFFLTYPFGIAMAHNGNVTNFVDVRKWLEDEQHRLLETSNDLALILYTFACELESKNLKEISVDDVFATVEAVQNRIEGAYSTIAIIANRGFLAFTDPYGIRPLIMGRRYTSKGIVYAFASETSCFDYLGYETMRDLMPGEAVFIDTERRMHNRICLQKKQAFCVFEFIYFAREDSVLHGHLAATMRVRMGEALAKTFRKSAMEADIIIDVPNSAYFSASGMAEELGISYRRGLSKNIHTGRSFILPTQEERERVLSQKLNPIRDVVRGKRIAVVDDSIVRGTTAKYLLRMLREAGAEKIYFVSAAPPICYPCIYGIDIADRQEIIATHYNPDEIARYIGADAVIYQDINDLREIFKDLPCCYACFNGEYPTGATQENINQIENEKIASNRC